MKHSKIQLAIVAVLASLAPAAGPATLAGGVNYAEAAAEVTREMETAFSLGASGLYARSRTDREPEFMWGNGVAFSALVAAARHDPERYRARLDRFFVAMDGYWDTHAPVPGYEPSPVTARGHDKYYDDNAWMVLTFLEAYDLTRDGRYLDRAKAAMAFVLSGEDDTLGGGIWWHEKHNDDSKNTCVTAPAAVGCLLLANHLPADAAAEKVATAKRLVDWTTARLRRDDGLFADKIKHPTGRVDPKAWTYNSGLMIRAYLGLHRRTGDATYLDQARRTGRAVEALVDAKSGVYQDSPKFTHLLVEADLELYRATGDANLIRRARANADAAFLKWKRTPPGELIENASIARMLWMVAEAASPAA